jgi:hypothetical protein
MWRLRLAPNSSPSKVRFNSDEPNLRSFDEFILKASPPPPRVGVETSPGFLLVAAKNFQTISSYSCVWWYYCSHRSITIHNYNVVVCKNSLRVFRFLHLCRCSPLSITDVVLIYVLLERLQSPSVLTSCVIVKSVTPTFDVRWPKLCIWFAHFVWCSNQKSITPAFIGSVSGSLGFTNLAVLITFQFDEGVILELPEPILLWA